MLCRDTFTAPSNSWGTGDIIEAPVLSSKFAHLFGTKLEAQDSFILGKSSHINLRGKFMELPFWTTPTVLLSPNILDLGFDLIAE